MIDLAVSLMCVIIYYCNNNNYYYYYSENVALSCEVCEVICHVCVKNFDTAMTG